MPETLYIIDGHAQIFRAYYAIRGGMRSPVTGEPTHAVFGFAGMLLKLLSQFKPHYVVVAIDVAGDTFRDEMFADYKGTRNATPDDLIAQIPRILEMVDLFGLPVIGHPGHEADDVIATIARRIVEDPTCKEIEVRIVSKDKDLEQMLGERVTMFDIQTDTTIDTAWLRENKGITPAQVIDVLALTGDTVDNVPGVPGIGPKTASLLIQQFGSIDGIYENIEKLKGKQRENLEKSRDVLALSRKLVTLRTDCDFPFSLEGSRVQPLQVDRILPLFQQLGFNRYQEDVRHLARMSEVQVSIQEPAAPAPKVTGSLFDNEEVEDETLDHAANGHYEAITTQDQLNQLVKDLRSSPIIAVDTETSGLGRNSYLCGLSLAWKEGGGVYVPVRSPDATKHLDESIVLSALKPLLEDPELPKCGHNLKFDTGVLLKHGVTLKGIAFDSMLGSIMIDPKQPAHKLDFVARELLHYRMIPITDLIGGGDDQLSIDQVPLDKCTTYAAEDADIALRLYHKMQPVLAAMGQEALMRDVEAPLTGVLARMENNGIVCNPEVLVSQGVVLQERVTELRRQICEIAGLEFDLNSTKQLAEVLFDKLGLAAGKKTKTGRSTDIEVLEKLAALEDTNDPRTLVPGLIIEYRMLSKLISTYLGNLANSVDVNTKRIHSTFHQLMTATGRLASQNPNLQNIPVRTDIGRQIRKAFIAPAEHMLVVADYSQIELRLLAHLSDDEALIDAFQRDLDIHTAVAAQVFNTPLEEVTRDQRSKAKTINFGIIYGVTPYGLARRIKDLDVPGATRLIADYKERFPGLDRFLQRCVHEALEKDYVQTILGRRRAIPEIHSSNTHTRSLGERLAINSVVQGSAADLIKVAMVNVQARIDRDNLPLKLLLQIHDELVLEAPAAEAEHLADIVRQEMENAMSLKIPLKAEAGIGPDWLEAK